MVLSQCLVQNVAALCVCVCLCFSLPLFTLVLKHGLLCLRVLSKGNILILPSALALCTHYWHCNSQVPEDYCTSPTCHSEEIMDHFPSPKRLNDCI